MDTIGILLVAAYASLLVELVALPVPSVASVAQLLETRVDGDDALARAKQRSPVSKLLLFMLPTALGVTAFLIPLVAVFWPSVIDYLLPLPQLETPAVRWTGAGIVVAGRAVTLVAVTQVRRHANANSLHGRGIYGYSRNPALLGLHAFYLGTCLIFPCLVLPLAFVVFAVNMHYRVLLEESHLSRVLGEPYREYRGRVPRYLFF